MAIIKGANGQEEMIYGKWQEDGFKHGKLFLLPTLLDQSQKTTSLVHTPESVL